MSIESIDDDTSSQPPVKKPKGFSKILGRCLGHSSAVPSTNQEKVKQKLDQYLSQPHLDVEECLLEWWKNESSCYPLVAQLARKYLSVCTTSVPLNGVGETLYLIKDHVSNQTKWTV